MGKQKIVKNEEKINELNDEKQQMDVNYKEKLLYETQMHHIK